MRHVGRTLLELVIMWMGLLLFLPFVLDLPWSTPNKLWFLVVGALSWIAVCGLWFDTPPRRRGGR